MRILVVHNAYQHKGGEDFVMEAEVALLRDRGHEVELFLRHNDSLSAMSASSAAAQTFWSTSVAREFERRLLDFKPAVVHAHNTFPLVSPAIYWVAARLSVPVVQTLHNFRLLCPQAMFLREGKVCEDCLGKIPWRGAIRGCYRDSIPQSAVVAGMLTAHRTIGTWQEKVTRYIALNAFSRNKFIEGGLPASRIVIKPNFVDFDAPPAVERSGFLFVGRLSAEKGIGVLVKASRNLQGAPIRVAGTGPEGKLLEDASWIEALGTLSGDAVRAEMCRAMALVLPSICYEQFPRTLVEAFGCGLPVITSRLGALPELVIDGVTGLLFDSGNTQDLAEKMRWAMAHPAQMAEMGRNGRKAYEMEFTADRNYRQLISIYDEAIADAKPPLGAVATATRNIVPVLQAPIDAVSWDGALDRIAKWASRRESRFVCICNSHSVVLAGQDAAFSHAVKEADMATPDGAPVAWMMRKLGVTNQQRINGPDLMWRYCEQAANRHESVYLYGSTPRTLESLRQALIASFPTLTIAGAESPPFRVPTEEEDTATIARMNASGAGTVWVSLGCPKQELWMAGHRGRVRAVMVGVGAAFDYHAGTVRRAPPWMQHGGLEWLYRLATEPRRLWRRYLVTNSLFMWGAALQLRRQHRSSS